MNEKRVAITARIPPALKKAVAYFCEREGLIIERFIEDALIRELEARRTGKK